MSKRRNDDVLGDIFDTENCVCDVVRAIADAQDDIRNDCDISCVRSIRDLVSPSGGRRNHDTVPFILYGKDLKPFKAYGATVEMFDSNPDFICTESFIFRVKEVSDDCCAVLELLTTDPNDPDDELEPVEDLENPCDQLENTEVAKVSRTGICITVDLKCFCAITCLPAVSVF